MRHGRQKLVFCAACLLGAGHRMLRVRAGRLLAYEERSALFFDELSRRDVEQRPDETHGATALHERLPARRDPALTERPVLDVVIAVAPRIERDARIVGDARAIVRVYATEERPLVDRRVCRDSVHRAGARVPDECAGDRVVLEGPETGRLENEPGARLRSAELELGLLGAAHRDGDARHRRSRRCPLLPLLPEVDEDAHLRADDIGIERLVEEVDGAARIALRDRVARWLVRGQDDDRYALATIELLQQRRGRETIELRHLEVEQDEREVFVLRLRHRLAARAREHEVLTERLEDRFERDEIRRMIVDEQDAGVRGRRRRCAAPAARWTLFGKASHEDPVGISSLLSPWNQSGCAPREHE